MKKSKKAMLVISLLLMAVVCSILLPLEASASEITDSGTCGATYGTLQWTLDEEGTLTISGSGDMKDWSASNDAPWYGKSIRSVIIESGVTSVGNRAFFDCTELENVAIPSSVTRIGNAAFTYCTSLTDIDIPNGVQNIGDSAFSNCTSLVDITIPGTVTGVSSYAFKDCTGLESISMSNGVQLVGSSAFYGCSSLTQIVIPESVTTIGNDAFYGCSSLTDVYVTDLSAWLNVSLGNVKSNPLAANSNSKDIYLNDELIENLVIPSDITSIRANAFYGCSNIINVVIPESVNSIGGYAFSGCSSLIAVEVPNTVTSIEAGVLEGCTSLEVITLPFLGSDNSGGSFSHIFGGSIPAGIKYVSIASGAISSGSFSNCQNLIYVDLPDDLTTIEAETFYGCHMLKGISIPSGVTNIGESAFYNCESLVGVSFPESVTSIGSFAFAYCNALNHISYEGTSSQWHDITLGTRSFYTNSNSVKAAKHYEAGVEQIKLKSTCLSRYVLCDYCDTILYEETIDGSEHVIENGICTECGMYGTCGDNLVWRLDFSGTLTISGTGDMYEYYFNAPWSCHQNIITSVAIEDGVTSIACSAFYGCVNLVDVDIPDSILSVGTYAFSGCEKLSGHIVLENITVLGASAFEYCTSLSSVTIGNGVTDIQWYTFQYCTNLSSITLPVNLKVIGQEAFYNCTNLTQIDIPDGVTSIEDGAFSTCIGLLSIDIPDSVTSIGSYVFANCTSLKNVKFGNGISIIGNSMFSDCINLRDIVIPDGVTTIMAYAFDNCSSLVSAVMGKGVNVVGSYSFRNCTNLEKVAFASSEFGVREWAFYNCSSLESVIYCGTEEEWNARYIEEYNEDLTSATLQFHSYINDTCEFCGNGLPVWEYTIADGEVTITGYTGNGTELIIPSTIEGLPVTGIGEEAFFGCTDLTSIDIPNSVTRIGTCAFVDCISLTSIDIPNSVTSIGEYAFSHCTGLTSITIPDSVTSIGSAAFYGCTGLTSIVIPESLTSIGDSVFIYCTELTSITIPDSVTSIDYSAFLGCTGLTSITIPDSVTSIDNAAFFDCTGLVKVVYCGTKKQWDAISIGDNNAPLTAATLQFHNIEGGVCNICGYIQEYTVTFKNWNGTVLSTNTYYWGDEITVPANPTRAADNTYTYAFTGWDNDVAANCAGNAIYTATYSSTHIDYTVVFKDWDGAELSKQTYHYGDVITAPNNPTRSADNTYTYTFTGWDDELTCTGDMIITAIFVSDYIDYTVIFQDWDGAELSKQTYHYGDVITAPQEPTRPADNTYSYTFTNWDKELVCTGDITVTAVYTPIYIDYTVVFQDWDGTEISRETYHFGDLITVPDDPTKASDTTYEYIFAGWDNEIVLHCEGDATYTATYTSQRKDCLLYSIQDGEVTITGYTGSAIELYIPSKIENLPVTKIGQNAFKDCSSLSYIWIPESVISIEQLAFQNCTGLTEIAVPNSVTSVGYGAFMGCSGLESMTLPFVGDGSGDYPLGWIFGQAIGNISYPGFSKVTQKYVASTTIYSNDFFIPDSLKSVTVTGGDIGYGAFSNCTGLTTISMLTSDPEPYIGYGAFSGCSNLESLVLPTAPTDICRIFGSESYSGSYEVLQHTACSDYSGSWKTYYLPRSLKNITITRGQIGECAFDSCYMLENVVLGSDVYAIDAYAFNECSNLKSVHLPKITYCDADAFRNPYGPNGEDDVQDVWYTGTLSDRENIVYNTYGNKAWFLRDATWHYSTCIYGHTYSTNCDTTCNSCEWVRSTIIDHIYDNECDTICNACNDTRTISHSYVEGVCEYCGDLATYVVVFTDEDGTELSSNTYHWGESITIPTNPTKPADNTYSYTFAGWDKPVVNCAGDVTYVATYTSTYIDYTVIFMNEDGTELLKKVCHWGDEIVPPEDPTKPSDNTYDYIFAGWDKEITEEVIICTGNVVYTATYEKHYIMYEVSFKNWNGDVISLEYYRWGDTITIPANPTRPADNTYTYTYNGWDKNVIECAGDAAYTATYNATYINYTVEFKDWDGTVISTQTYHWDDAVRVPNDPARAADNTYTYSFDEWENCYEEWKVLAANCAGNATYIATYNATYIDYVVAFKNWDGTVLSTKAYHYGDSVTTPANPTRPSDNNYIYTFTGWDKTVVACDGNVVYTAVYSSQTRVPSAVTSSTYTISGTTISKISTGTTVATLVGKLNEGKYVRVYNGSQEVSGSTLIGTGMVVKIMDGNTAKATYTIVVTGDTNGDGKITVTDMLAVKAHVLKKSTLTGASAQAADTSGDNAISITDFIQMKAQILGKSNVEPRSVNASVQRISTASVETETSAAIVTNAQTTMSSATKTVSTLNNPQIVAIIPDKKSLVTV